MLKCWLLLGCLIVLSPSLGCGSNADSVVAPQDPHSAVLGVWVEPCNPTQTTQLASAVAISPDLVATVAHPFTEFRRFTLYSAEGKEHGATFVWFDPDIDLALLRLDSPTETFLALRSTPINDGDLVRVLVPRRDHVDFEAAGVETGPLGDNKEIAPDSLVREGSVLRQVTATLDGRGQRAAIEISADIQAGDSGAPLVDENDTIAGIVFASVKRSERGWAVAASEVEHARSALAGDATAHRTDPDLGRCVNPD